MTRGFRSLFALMFALLVSGCAGMHVAPDGDKSLGVRYYQRAPFLIVYTDNAGGLTSRLVYLPDTRKVLSAYPYSILATNKTTLEFNEGTLTSGEVDADTAVIPKAVVTALAKIAEVAVKNRNIAAGKGLPPPSLYRIDVMPDGTVKLVGAESTQFIGFGKRE